MVLTQIIHLVTNSCWCSIFGLLNLPVKVNSRIFIKCNVLTSHLVCTTCCSCVQFSSANGWLSFRSEWILALYLTIANHLVLIAVLNTGSPLMGSSGQFPPGDPLPQVWCLDVVKRFPIRNLVFFWLPSSIKPFREWVLVDVKLIIHLRVWQTAELLRRPFTVII